MPTRQGSKARKARRRRQSGQEPEPKDKGDRGKDHNDGSDYEDWLDDDDYVPPTPDLAFDLESTDERPVSLISLPTTARQSRPQHQEGNAAGPSSTATASSYVSSTYVANNSVDERVLDDHQIPNEVSTIFSNIMSSAELGELLKNIQNEEDRYCEPKDEHDQRTTRTKKSPFPRFDVTEHFKQRNFMDFTQDEGKRVLNYLRDYPLKKSSYGVLLYNSKGEILAVQRYSGEWTAPKDYRRINDKNQLESIKETAARKFNEDILITNRTTNEIYDLYRIIQSHQLNANFYREYTNRSNSQSIGLFIIKIDESNLAFNLPNSYEYQNCQWLQLDEVLNHTPPKGTVDQYSTLRPFVEWIQSHSMFNDGRLNDD